jgi:hypothetical protein
MPILRRILKFTPAVVLGLLVMAWVASVFTNFGMSSNLPRSGTLSAGAAHSTFHLILTSSRIRMSLFFGGESWWNMELSSLLGSLAVTWPRGTIKGAFFELQFPAPLLLSLILPIAIAPFISFRFRLRHYLAYTALIAVELAYYLRWQE